MHIIHNAGIPGAPKAPLDEASLFCYHKMSEEEYHQLQQTVKEAAEMINLEKWQTFDPSLLDDCPDEVPFVGSPMSKNEVMNMYKASRSVEETLIVYAAMVQRRKENFPPPGWAKWMLQSGFLKECNLLWSREASVVPPTQNGLLYATWKREVYDPKPGSAFRSYVDLAVTKRIPSLKITTADDMEEEAEEGMEERPVKLRK